MKHLTPAEFDRIFDKVDASGDCWEWMACRNPKGYGQVQFRGRRWLAPRLVWTLLVAEIPEGLTVDHLCFSPSCVNPDHLRLLTVADNSALRNRVGGAPLHKRQQTHCKHGHPFDEANTYIKPNGCRACRRCRADTQQRRRDRTRAMA